MTDHINTIRAAGIAFYGLLYLFIGVTILLHGSRQSPFIFWQRFGVDWRWPVIPGRIPVGVFFLFACWREWDTALNRIRWGGGARSAAHVNDWNSVVPLYVGAVFGVWAVLRFLRNDVSERK